jgi:hypothetical protein
VVLTRTPLERLYSRVAGLVGAAFFDQGPLVLDHGRDPHMMISVIKLFCLISSDLISSFLSYFARFVAVRSRKIVAVAVVVVFVVVAVVVDLVVAVVLAGSGVLIIPHFLSSASSLSPSSHPPISLILHSIRRHQDMAVSKCRHVAGASSPGFCA